MMAADSVTDDTSVIVDLPDALGKLLVKNHREDQQTPCRSKAPMLTRSTAINTTL